MKPGTGVVLIILLLACAAACTGAQDSSPAMPPTIAVESPAFAHEGSIPTRYTCDGDDISPALNWTGVPADTVSLALVMDDPDAPVGTFTHWLVWNISPGTGGLPEGVAEGDQGIIQGTNDFGAIGYGGPCPPDAVHRYRFRILALDDLPALEQGAGRGEVDLAVEGHIIAWGELQGTYGRS
jgi:Raf kinase inhibitor-like YbhB/YbcL family protein